MRAKAISIFGAERASRWTDESSAGGLARWGNYHAEAPGRGYGIDLVLTMRPSPARVSMQLESVSHL